MFYYDFITILCSTWDEIFLATLINAFSPDSLRCAL